MALVKSKEKTHCMGEIVDNTATGSTAFLCLFLFLFSCTDLLTYTANQSDFSLIDDPSILHAQSAQKPTSNGRPMPIVWDTVHWLQVKHRGKNIFYFWNVIKTEYCIWTNYFYTAKVTAFSGTNSSTNFHHSNLKTFYLKTANNPKWIMKSMCCRADEGGNQEIQYKTSS